MHNVQHWLGLYVLQVQPRIDVLVQLADDSNVVAL